MNNEKDIYLESIRGKKQNGLRDVKFYPGNTFDKSEEQVYAELNRLHAAKDLPDRDVLGERYQVQLIPVCYSFHGVNVTQI